MNSRTYDALRPQCVKKWRSVRCTEAGSVWRLKVCTVYRGLQRLKTEGPYVVPKPAACEDVKFRTVYLGRQRLKTWRSVRFTEAGSVWRSKGPYGVPRPAASEDWRSVRCTEVCNVWRLKVRTLYRGRQRVKTWRYVRWTEAGSMWRNKGPYCVPRPTACKVKVRTVYRGRQRVFQGSYSAPSPYRRVNYHWTVNITDAWLYLRFP